MNTVWRHQVLNGDIKFFRLGVGGTINSHDVVSVWDSPRREGALPSRGGVSVG